jgi:hypothetical protein
MAGGGAVAGGGMSGEHRVRIKGRRSSALRFFLMSVRPASQGDGGMTAARRRRTPVGGSRASAAAGWAARAG